MRPNSNYRPDIDGLRAVAVMAVVLYHLGLPLNGGFVGVDVFFVISGYLITRIINKDIADGSFSFLEFYHRRIRRILPALAVVLLTVSLVSLWILLPSDLSLYSRSLPAALLGLSNIFFWRNTGYFSRGGEFSPLLHTWSLAVEEQFYLLFPPLLILLNRFIPKRIKPALIAVAVSSFGLSVYAVYERPGTVFFLPMFRAWELLMGCIIALYPMTQWEKSRRWVNESMAAFGITLILLAILTYSEATIFPGLSALMPCLGAALLLRYGQSIVSRVLSLRSFVFTGLISYSLYLWHWPLIVFFKHWWYRNPTWLEAIGIGISSFILAILSWKFVEKPFRDRAVIKTPLVIGSVFVTLLAVSLYTYLVLNKNGNVGNHDSQVVMLDQERSPIIPYEDCFGLKKSIQDYCLVGSAEAAATAVIWGDSHSLAALPALSDALKELKLSAIYVGSSNCPPIFDMEYYDTKLGSYGCQSLGEAVIRITEGNANISTVIFSAAWKRYTTSSNKGAYLTHHEAKGEIRTLFAKGILETFTYLNDRHIKLIVIGPVPGAGYDVPFVMARATLKGTPIPEAQGKTQFLQDFENYNRIMADTKSVIDFRYVPLDAIFFKSADQMTYENGLPLYRDNGHLNVRGAKKLVPTLINALSWK